MLSGERVVLRPIQRSDLPRLWELLEDFEVALLSEIGPIGPTSLAQYQVKFDEQAAHPRDDVARFAIESAGQVIGEGGLHHVDHFNQRCELGIALGREYWGQGLGQDAVRTLLAYAFEHLNMNRVALEVLAGDDRAVGAYRKVGFVEEGRLRRQSWVRGTFEDVLVMAVLRDDWIAGPRRG